MLTNNILDTDTGWRLYDIELGAGETYEFPATASLDCVGSIYVRGVLSAEEDWPAISEHRDWRPRDAWGRWKDEAEAEGTAKLTASEGGARWLCVAGKVMVEKVSVSVSYVAPAGVELIVGWTQAATIVVGDQEGESGEYFEASETPVTIVGTCDLLLVRRL